MQLIIKPKKGFVFLNLLMAFAIHAERYTLVIEPTYPIEQGREVYEPLRQWLNKKTGHDFEIIIDKIIIPIGEVLMVAVTLTSHWMPRM